MPVVEIRALPQPPSVDVERVLADVTRAVAAVLGEEPRGTWATWEEIPFARYSEGGVLVQRQPAATHPPLVRVSGGRRPDALVARILNAVSAAVTHGLGLEDGNAFVRWEELDPAHLRVG